MDLRTLFTAQTALLVAIALMLRVGASDDDRRSGLREWGLGVGAQAVAFLLLAQVGRLPMLWTGPVANAFGAASVALFHVAILRFLGHRLPVRRLLAGVAAVVAVAVAAGEAYWVSTAFNGVVYGVVQLANARALWKVQQPELRRMQRTVALAYLLMGVVLPLRAAALLAQWLRWDYLQQPQAVQGPLFLFGFLFIVVTHLGFLQLCKARAESEVRQQALTDELTGLPNRRAFGERLREAMDRARRRHRPLSLVLADLDHFKSINDRFGHDGGDRALAGFAQRLQRALGPQHACFRLGGEEFCVLLVDEPVHRAAGIADALRFAVRASGDCGGAALTASFGIAGWDGEESADVLLQRADRALYRAKAGGRDRVVVDEPPEAQAAAA